MKKLEIMLMKMPCDSCKGTGKTGILIKKQCPACKGIGKVDKTFGIEDILMVKMPYLTELATRVNSIGTDSDAMAVISEALSEIFGNQFTPEDVRLHMGFSQINDLFSQIANEKNA